MTDKKDVEGLTAMHWAGSIGSGLLAGAALVAVAMLLEKEVVAVGSSLFGLRAKTG